MSWIIIALAAQFALGSSSVIDKLLLKKSYPNPAGYTFWLGILGLASLILIPFGFHFTVAPILLGLLAGATFIIALLLFYFALSSGEASNTIPLIGALSPIATLVWSYYLLHIGLNTLEFFAFLLLVIGGALLASTEPKSVRFKVILLALASSFFFGFTNALTKTTFLQTNFVTGFVLIKIGGVLAALLLIVIPSVRKKILHPAHKDEFHNRWGYFLNRGLAGVGSILLYFAFSLGSPPLVDATHNLQYAFVLIGGWLILKERFRGVTLTFKIIALIFISLGVIFLGALDYMATHAPDPNRPVEWGITFSDKFSKQMGLDWKENYDAILNDLGAKHIRLVAYWDDIEPQKGQFDFTDLDYEMSHAQEAGAQVVLVVGEKAPRWPECHYPAWAALPTDAARREQLPPYIQAVVSRYKSNSALLYWQVENEPFLNFGECVTTPPDSLVREISLVKSLDPSHRVLTTDGGEFGTWYGAASLGDVFGTTMYRRVHSDRWGYFDYHLPPSYFSMKDRLIHWLLGDPQKPFLVIELGAEPWLQHQLYETAIPDQLAVFDLPFFKDTIGYAKNTGFHEYYLWGAEWWYWMKTKHNMPEFWDYAKTVFESSR